MYIVAIAWLYVTMLMATAETSWVAGVMTFAFYGLAPLALLLWLFGIPRRSRGRRLAASDTMAPSAPGRGNAPHVSGEAGEAASAGTSDTSGR